jgi:RNAse (barnase) inhibitor barstar
MTVRVDIHLFETKRQLADQLREAEGFPDYVSDNWDSIEEALHDFAAEAPETLEMVHHFDPAELPEEMKTYLDVLGDLGGELGGKLMVRHVPRANTAN